LKTRFRGLPARFLWGATASVCLGDLSGSTSLGGRRAELAGKSVLVVTRDQLAAALTLIELDGIARRLIVCTPDLSSEHLPAVVSKADVDAIVSDRDRNGDGLAIPLRVLCHGTISPGTPDILGTPVPTEWVLLTSGTSGAAKMIVHNIASLTAAIGRAPGNRPVNSNNIVWGTFYDIRRYGGLQILFRAVLGRGSFVVAGAGEPIGEYLVRLGAHGATHVSGTPSHWRRALMSPRSFARRFKATTGTTPHAWLLGQRLAAAEALLEESDAPVEEIARLVGFGTAAGLREQFGRRRGVSPRAYRQTFRAGARSGPGTTPVQLDQHRTGRVGGDQTLVEAEFGQPA